MNFRDKRTTTRTLSPENVRAPRPTQFTGADAADEIRRSDFLAAPVRAK
jgi:hypothetical protein